MLTSEFDYHLPEELIATEPLADRAASRMLVVDRAQQSITHASFRDLPGYICAGDILVLNDSRVVPARYFSNDGTKELLRLEVLSPTEWRCMVKPGRKLRLGHLMEIGEAIGTVVQVHDASGDRVIRFDRMVDEARHGHLALPPYMHREEEVADRQRYQTVYARESGSIAAPTAGLHFTPELLQRLPHAFVTLHVGVGTFQPVKAERVADHLMHTEHYCLNEAEAKKIQASRRVIAVGTTAARVLESIFRKHHGLKADCGETDIFIYPPYDFSAVGALLTNFHLPKSTLMMLVSAFAGKELIMSAYQEAIQARYRFYSYGDCMLIL